MQLIFVLSKFNQLRLTVHDTQSHFSTKLIIIYLICCSKCFSLQLPTCDKNVDTVVVEIICDMIPVYKAMDFLVLQLKPKSALLVGNKTCILEFETTNFCYFLTCKLSTPDYSSRNIAYLCKRSWKIKWCSFFLCLKYIYF